ncbi:MAG: hypothetical protein OEY36_11325 [Gammaproteobacteria bacterium]|nr:hypothetical protein [Gammaproteobacteria bacterium]
MNKSMFVLLLAALMLTACGGSDKVKEEEYQFADGLRLLDVPPNLTSPDKNLVMEIPQPSLIACEKLMDADRKFKAEAAQKALTEK